VQQGPHGADVGDVAGEVARQSVLGSTDVGMPAPLDEVQDLVAGHLGEIAHAALAVDAALAVQRDEAAQRMVLLRLPLRELEAGLAAAILVTAVLQLAGTSLVTGRAVQRVIYQ